MPHLIRKAVPADMPELLRMGRAFHASNRMANVCPFDEESTTATLNIFLQGTLDCILLVSDHIPDVLTGNPADNSPSKLGGMLALLAAPNYMNRHFVIVQELFWWAEDGKGMKLIEHGKAWVRERGWKYLMLAETGRGDERSKLVYKRMGFEPIERFYLADVAHETSRG